MIVLPPKLAALDAAVALLSGGAIAWLLLNKLSQQWSSRSQLRAFDKDGKEIALRELPMPSSTLPVLGNLLDNLKYHDRFLDWVVERSLEFNNEPWKRKIPGQPELITVTSPEAIEEITIKQFENFDKGSFQIEILEDIIGRGLIASDGERWYHQRKTAAKFFSARSLRAFMTKSMNKNIQQMCAALERTATRKRGSQAPL